MMKILVDNWAVIVISIAALLMVTKVILNLSSLSHEQKLDNLKNWMLFAVVKAEKELGSGTGRIKLAYVYKMFVDAFPKYAEIITFEVFSRTVDIALCEMKTILSNNDNLKAYIEEGK